MKYEVNFYLDRRRDKNGNLIDHDMMILLYFSFDGKRLQFYTGHRIDLTKWDPEGQRVKKNNVNKRGYTSSEINEHLAGIEIKVIQIYKEAVTLGLNPSVNYMRDQLKERLIKDHLKTSPIDKETPFLKLFDQYIEKIGQIRSHGYIKQLKSTRQHIENFSKKKNVSLNYAGINELFFERFRDYFIKDLGNTNNSFAGQIKRFKRFMKWATDRRPTGKNFEYLKFIATEKYNSPVIYLTWSEFLQLYHAKIDNKHLQTVRDIFIFQSMTAMRYDDLFHLKKENLKDNFIEYYQGKTKKFVKVPFNEFTSEIKKKYADYAPDKPLPTLANQLFNRSLKDLFRVAELNRIVEVIKTRGTEEVKEFKPLYELASSHMARRNFIGMSIEKKVPSEVIKSISGHTKDSKAFGRYYEIDEKLKVSAMKVFKP
jgi:sRNA-binding carbon storage regulator CsrA